MSAADIKCPVQLQFNNSGAWKTVARFDASDEPAVTEAQTGALYLYSADRRTKWRIATVDRHPVVLRQMDAGTNGLWREVGVPS